MQDLTNSLRRSNEREVKKKELGFAHKNVKKTKEASKVSKDKTSNTEDGVHSRWKECKIPLVSRIPKSDYD